MGIRSAARVALATVFSLTSFATLAAPDLPLPPAFEEFPGAVAVAVPRLAADAKWHRVMGAQPGPGRPCAVHRTSDSCAASLGGRWNDLVLRLSGLSGEERLQAANESVNAAVAYASDNEVYGVADHWATLAETLDKGRGDCEDIAIVKMWLLNAAGVKLSAMRLVVLRDTLRNLDHAVLSVIEGGHQYVLDNTTWKVGRADWMRGYQPIYALSSDQSWIYGVRVPVAPPLQVADIGAAPELAR
jgi:predicted transglutaminase-like cysteine proteinase